MGFIFARFMWTSSFWDECIWSCSWFLTHNQTIHFLGKKEDPARYAISGKVVDDQGRGLPSVRITFTDAEDNAVTTVTDSQVTLLAVGSVVLTRSLPRRMDMRLIGWKFLVPMIT